MAYHVYDHAAAQRLLTAHSGGVGRDMWARGRRVRNAQRRLVGRTSGDLARDLHVQWVPPPHKPGVEVGSDLPQAILHAKGHPEIRPVRAKALRFKPKGSKQFIFRMKAKEVPPNRYLQRSLRAARRGGY
jgi:hypothetical protein